jgi:hypothetical protein
VVHGPDHVIARLDQLVNFEVEDFDVLVIILAAREPLPGELEPLGRQVVNLDSIVDVLVDVVDRGGLPREDTVGKFGDVLLDADVCHFDGFCSENNYGNFSSGPLSIYILCDTGVK